MSKISRKTLQNITQSNHNNLSESIFDLKKRRSASASKSLTANSTENLLSIYLQKDSQITEESSKYSFKTKKYPDLNSSTISISEKTTDSNLCDNQDSTVFSNKIQTFINYNKHFRKYIIDNFTLEQINSGIRQQKNNFSHQSEFKFKLETQFIEKSMKQLTFLTNQLMKRCQVWKNAEKIIVQNTFLKLIIEAAKQFFGLNVKQMAKIFELKSKFDGKKCAYYFVLKIAYYCEYFQDAEIHNFDNLDTKYWTKQVPKTIFSQKNIYLLKKMATLQQLIAQINEIQMLEDKIEERLQNFKHKNIKNQHIQYEQKYFDSLLQRNKQQKNAQINQIEKIELSISQFFLCPSLYRNNAEDIYHQIQIITQFCQKHQLFIAEMQKLSTEKKIVAKSEIKSKKKPINAQLLAGTAFQKNSKKLIIKTQRKNQNQKTLFNCKSQVSLTQNIVKNNKMYQKHSQSFISIQKMKKNNEKLKYSYHSLDETDKKLW